MRLDSVWSELETTRARLEGEPGPAALVGGLLGLVLEGWRFLSASVEKADAVRKVFEERLERVRARLDLRSANRHRVADAGVTLTNVNTTLTNNGGTVQVESDSTATDQAARIRIMAGSVSVVASTLASVQFARSFSDAPVILAQQDSGPDIGLRVANVTSSGFDLATAGGIAPATTVTVVVAALATQLDEHIP